MISGLTDFLSWTEDVTFMIKRKTVLALGAGASMPYGFPSARDLIFEICDGLAMEHLPLATALQKVGHSFEDLSEFRKRLQHSGQPSVDLFLEARKEWMELGKDAIAATLIPHEEPARLHRFKGRLDWYEYLFQRLSSPAPDTFIKNRLSVLTFNYDRSLEEFLRLCLKHSYSLDGKAASEMLKNIPIVHLYGRLQEFPWLEGKRGRDYGPRLTPQVIQNSAQSIKIVHEMEEAQIYRDPEFSKAHMLLGEADVICFLGFGYHRENLRRLGVNAPTLSREIWGSAYGIGDGERPAIEREFGHFMGKPKIKLGKDSEDALTFLKSYPVLG